MAGVHVMTALIEGDVLASVEGCYSGFVCFSVTGDRRREKPLPGAMLPLSCESSLYFSTWMNPDGHTTGAR